MTETATDAAKGRWFPEQPPALPGESDGAYTDRLTGADQTGRVPYDHVRYRECSLGFHGTCSQRGLHDGSCKCPCHSELGEAQLALHELEETAVALWAIATGRLKAADPEGFRRRVLGGEERRIDRIIGRRPQLAEWYLEAGQ